MRKRTTIDLDMALLDEAAVVLKTTRISETVQAALNEVVALPKRLRLVDLDPDLTVERLQVDRAGRAPTT